MPKCSEWISNFMSGDFFSILIHYRQSRFLSLSLLQDTSPIYLFSKSTIESSVPPSPSLNLGSGITMHPPLQILMNCFWMASFSFVFQVKMKRNMSVHFPLLQKQVWESKQRILWICLQLMRLWSQEPTWPLWVAISWANSLKLFHSKYFMDFIYIII